MLNADAQVLGGITEWKKVADLAMSSHVLLAPHGDQEIHAHLVASVPNGLIAEYYDNNTKRTAKKICFRNYQAERIGADHGPPGAGVRGGD